MHFFFQNYAFLYQALHSQALAPICGALVLIYELIPEHKLNVYV